ncbi:MAG: hypothetical protein ACK4S4_04740 [Pyrinomonadaceae bacterium]
MGRLLLGLLIGILLGGGLSYFLLVGTPRSSPPPGEPMRPPDASAMPPGTAQIVLRQDFFNGVLNTVFSEMNPPVFALDRGGRNGECPSQLTILRQGSGAESIVRLEGERLGANLAFNGNYNSPVGCIAFSGWADSNFELRYDPANKSVFGQLNVANVNLDGVNPIFAPLITPIIQSTINSRVNPIPIVDGARLSLNIPMAAAGGELNAVISDVRGEVKDNALNLYVVYDFSGRVAR